MSVHGFWVLIFHTIYSIGMRFAYDLSNQPVRMRTRRSTLDYVYDGNFKRVKQTRKGKVVHWVYDASGALIHRHNLSTRKSTDYLSLGSHPVTRLERKKGKERVIYLFTNHQGTPELGRTDNGTWKYRDHYTPYGEHYHKEHATSRNNPGFTGHVDDYQTGLTYMQARYYDPVLGRFLSNDPVGFADSGFDPAYFNRYAYAGNDPVNKIDPDGRFFEAFLRADLRVAGGLGGRVSFELNVDFKNGELSGSGSIGASLGLKAKGDVVAGVRPATRQGNNLSAKGEVATVVNSGEVRLGFVEGTLGGVDIIVDSTDPERAGTLETQAPNVEVKSNVGLGFGAGVTTDVIAWVEGSVNLGDAAKAVADILNPDKDDR